MRVPIVRPHRVLKKTMPYVEPLYSRPVSVLMAVFLVTGLYLVARQWEIFVKHLPLFF